MLKEVALDNFEPVKRENIINFFKEKFNIDLEKYNDDEINVIYNEIDKKIDQVIEAEVKKNELLTNELHKKQVELLYLVNEYANITS